LTGAYIPMPAIDVMLPAGDTNATKIAVGF